VKESWNALLHPPTPTDDILAQVLDCKAKAVVVTGGEPLNYNMDYFTAELRKNGFKTYVETSGSSPLSGEWDWICVSPKRNKPPLKPIFDKASELKVIIEDESDFEWATIMADQANADCHLYLQPEWSQASIMMQRIVDFALDNPRWKISVQTHKYMHIP
jgi:organic radical activating enzyme